MAVFVLVHGAWHGAWCWERVAPLLERRRHRVLAPDLPGMAQDPTPLPAVTLDLWARFVADLVGRQSEPVILVGHSRGGVVISQAAELVPNRIAVLVYLTAFLVPNGASLWSTMQLVPRDPARAPDLVMSEDRTTSTLAPQAVGNTFYNTTDEAWASRAAALVGAEPMAAWLTPLALSDDAFGRVPRIYVECRRDRAIPPALQRLMVAALPCPVVSMDTDHSPFYSVPEQLAETLASIAADA
jgi:pimeloyl-ACP methyl ester carboxylesterase